MSAMISLKPDGPLTGPTPEDGRIINCFSGESDLQTKQFYEAESEPPYSTSVSYSIPTSANLVYFLSEGHFGKGGLRFELSDKQDDELAINVIIKYYKEEMLKNSQICSLERDNGGRGIGFFVSSFNNEILWK